MKHSINKPLRQKGYTLLFAVIVSVLVLSVATFIVAVARKQFLLSSAARDSLYALYAADTGLECAINNINSFSTSTNPGSITCGLSSTLSGGDYLPGSWPTVFLSDPSGAATTTFSMYAGANDSGTAPSCAFITVEMWTDPTSHNLIESIKSRGYNIGWNSNVGDCSIAGPRKVERAIQVLYQ